MVVWTILVQYTFRQYRGHSLAKQRKPCELNTGASSSILVMRSKNSSKLELRKTLANRICELKTLRSAICDRSTKTKCFDLSAIAILTQSPQSVLHSPPPPRKSQNHYSYSNCDSSCDRLKRKVSPMRLGWRAVSDPLRAGPAGNHSCEFRCLLGVCDDALFVCDIVRYAVCGRTCLSCVPVLLENGE